MGPVRMLGICGRSFIQTVIPDLYTCFDVKAIRVLSSSYCFVYKYITYVHIYVPTLSVNKEMVLQ